MANDVLHKAVSLEMASGVAWSAMAAMASQTGLFRIAA